MEKERDGAADQHAQGARRHGDGAGASALRWALRLWAVCGLTRWSVVVGCVWTDAVRRVQRRVQASAGRDSHAWLWALGETLRAVATLWHSLFV